MSIIKENPEGSKKIFYQFYAEIRSIMNFTIISPNAQKYTDQRFVEVEISEINCDLLDLMVS